MNAVGGWSDTRRACEWADALGDTDPTGRAPRSFCIFGAADYERTVSPGTPPTETRRFYHWPASKTGFKERAHTCVRCIVIILYSFLNVNLFRF